MGQLVTKSTPTSATMEHVTLSRESALAKSRNKDAMQYTTYGLMGSVTEAPYGAITGNVMVMQRDLGLKSLPTLMMVKTFKQQGFIHFFSSVQIPFTCKIINMTFLHDFQNGATNFIQREHFFKKCKKVLFNGFVKMQFS